MRTKKELSWQVGFSDDAESRPIRRVPAAVPGAVQLDWAKAESYGEYWYDDNFNHFTWMEDKFWSYETVLDIPELSQGERLYFISRGVDYKFFIKLDGRILHEQEGMFTPVEIELTGLASHGSTLEIRISPVPKREGAPATRAQADQSCKPAVSYGWDWHPRLVPSGIWDDTYLEIRQTVNIVESEVSYVLRTECCEADVQARVVLSSPGAGTVDWSLYDRQGRRVANRTVDSDSCELTLICSLEQVELWWPNGQGDPVLYTSRIELRGPDGSVADAAESKVGFRTVRLVMHPGAWSKPTGFPKSRSNPPITVEINGREIFCKGSNWVNPEIFPGIITAETYRPLIELAAGAHMNMFRIWGGGIVNKTSFYELCDEKGIMVWQEFPLACNHYVGTPEYLKVLDQESRSIIKRLRAHPSVVLWCGGNELFNSWSRMTDQSLALRLLNRNCYDLDPGRPFLMTSPVMGMGHGHYWFRDMSAKEDVFQWMPRSSNTAYTEFGCPSPSSVELLKSFIPEDELYPPRPGTAWETHHAFGAWEGNTWLCPEVLEYYFGPSHSLEELVERGQLLQSEGYKCIYEEGRRQKPVCSMVLNWCYNEPWPTAANNNLISWPSEPKPSYYAVAASCRPILASARIRKFVWEEGEWFDPELWVLNDSPEGVPAGSVEAYLEAGGSELPLLAWSFPQLEAGSNRPGPTVRYQLPRLEAERVRLLLKVPDNPAMNSAYTLLYHPKQQRAAPRPDLLNF